MGLESLLPPTCPEPNPSRIQALISAWTLIPGSYLFYLHLTSNPSSPDKISLWSGRKPWLRGLQYLPPRWILNPSVGFPSSPCTNLLYRLNWFVFYPPSYLGSKAMPFPPSLTLSSRISLNSTCSSSNNEVKREVNKEKGVCTTVLYFTC